jgi:hypothetical protein
VSERAKTVYASDRSATANGSAKKWGGQIRIYLSEA